MTKTAKLDNVVVALILNVLNVKLAITFIKNISVLLHAQQGIFQMLANVKNALALSPTVIPALAKVLVLSV